MGSQMSWDLWRSSSPVPAQAGPGTAIVQAHVHLWFWVWQQMETPQLLCALPRRVWPFIPSHQVFLYIMISHWAFSSPDWTIHFLQPLLLWETLQSLDHGPLSRGLSPVCPSLSFLGGPAPAPALPVCLTSAEQRKGSSPCTAGSALSHAAQEAVCLLVMKSHCWLMGSLYPPGPQGSSQQICSSSGQPPVHLGTWGCCSTHAGLGRALWEIHEVFVSPVLQPIEPPSLWMAAWPSDASATPPKVASPADLLRGHCPIIQLTHEDVNSTGPSVDP